MVELAVFELSGSSDFSTALGDTGNGDEEADCGTSFVASGLGEQPIDPTMIATKKKSHDLGH